MRKKVFAILLTLCMVLTMMPAVAWADGDPVPDLEPVKLYAIYSDAVPENGIITADTWNDTINIRLDNSAEDPTNVPYLGYMVGNQENQRTFQVLNGLNENGDLVLVQNDGVYKLWFEGPQADDDVRQQVFLRNGVEYTLDYMVTPPRLSAYSSNELKLGCALKGRNIEYDQLPDGENGNKVVYFMANDDSVTKLGLVEGYNTAIFTKVEEIKDSTGKFACLQVTVDSNVDFEEFQIVATSERIEDEKTASFQDYYDFRITGNILFSLDLEDDESATIDTFIPDDCYSSAKIYLPPEPEEEISVILGMPVEENGIKRIQNY